MTHAINWTFEQHKQYATEQERRAQREQERSEAVKGRDTERVRRSS